MDDKYEHLVLEHRWPDGWFPAERTRQWTGAGLQAALDHLGPDGWAVVCAPDEDTVILRREATVTARIGLIPHEEPK